MQQQRPRIRRRTFVLGMGSLGGAAILGTAACNPDQEPPEPQLPSTTGSATPAATTLRPRYHFSVPDHWLNDPQRPLWIDGRWHYWYLYNGDYPKGSGTAWRLATSDDLVHWHDQGIAIPKNSNANGDVWSGSAVVDSANTAGLGAGTVVALATQPDHSAAARSSSRYGSQAQFLWYSLDRGRTFRAWGSAPVLANPGRKDFRDPKLVRDDTHARWVALVAEGDRIGLWTSTDLKHWKSASEFVPATSGGGDLGVLECPDLFKITTSDGSTTWVLGCGANGYRTGAPNTWAYWTGSFDGTRFTPERTAPQWLDHGFDFYAAVTFEHRTDPQHVRNALGWMNNWSYPDTTPTTKALGFNGANSVVRELRCKKQGTGHVLVSTPVLTGLAGTVHRLGDVQVDGSHTVDFSGTAYRLDADLSWTEATNVGLRLRVSGDGKRHVDVGVYGDHSYLNRSFTGSPDSTGKKQESHASFSGKATHLTVLVDHTSVEVFVGDGEVVHTSQVFPNPTDTGLELFSDGGAARFGALTVTELGQVVQRPARLLADFEWSSLPKGWSSAGTLAGLVPAAANHPGQVGNRVLDTYHGSDRNTGTVQLPAFTLDRDHLHLLVGGGRHPAGAAGQCVVRLVVGGTVVRTATGSNDDRLRPVDWDVRPWAGRQAVLQVVDQATGSWGHLLVDQVLLSD